MPVDPVEHERQVERYSEERPRYVLYADVLSEALTRACKDCETVGIVQTRAKSIPSFAEKIVRRSDRYSAPVSQMTDLCGARVITQTQPEVRRICRFVRENFRIDEANSMDVLRRLRPEEFGYRSVHYVVQLRGDRPCLEEAIEEVSRRKGGIDVLERIGERKAEIQVRTLLQHAWAGISHDRVYKSEFDVPDRFRRELARVAALLEDADGQFGRAVEALDAYKSHYGAYMDPEEMRKEIAKWEMVLRYDRENSDLADRIAALAISLEDWQKAMEVLEPFRHSGSAPVLRDLGLAKHQAGEGGRAELERAVALDPTDADALCALGDTWEEEPEKALHYYERAFEAAPGDAHVLANYLECKTGFVGDVEFISLMRPSLEAAVETCRDWAEVEIYLPWAFYDMGTFALLLDRPYQALAAYARGIELSASPTPICLALRSVEHYEKPILRSLPEMPAFADLNWAIEAVRRFLLLAVVVTAAGREASGEPEREKQMPGEVRERTEELEGLVSADLSPVSGDVAMVSGGCAASVEQEMQQYREMLREAFEGFRGIVVGGGTTAGVSGLAADATEGPADEVRRIGYRPFFMPPLPDEVKLHEGYEVQVTTDMGRGRAEPHTRDFTALEPLQSWIDLIAAGVDPADVRVLVINGGPITGFEARLALALGATVGVVESSGRSASELREERRWWPASRLIWLPPDPAAVRAFVNPATPQIPAELVERAGKAVHERFLEENRYRSADPAMVPWQELREDLKESNRQQAAYAEQTLRRIGYGVGEAEGEPASVQFTDEEVETMAEMEHGRWILERLRAGWSYGPRRDAKVKVSPYLVPWEELPEKIKEYDRQAVRDWPEVLGEAGLEVYKL